MDREFHPERTYDGLNEFDDVDTRMATAILIIGATTVLTGVGYLLWRFTKKRKR